MDVSQYLEIFIDETREHIQNLSDHIMVLEQEPDNADTINEIFRAAHSLKGMAGTMGYKRMQHLTHMMENVFSEVRNGTVKVTSSMVDVLFQCLDAVEAYLEEIVNTTMEGENDNEPIIKLLNGFLEKDKKAEEEKDKEEEKAPVDEPPREIKLSEFEINAISEALTKGMNVFKIRVHVDENCILKAARAFLVFKALEELGEIIKSDPSVQDIEDEKFEFDFTVIIVTNSDKDATTKAVSNVLEIKRVDTEPITEVSKPIMTSEPKEEEPPKEKQEEKTEVAKTETAPAKTPEKKAAPLAKSGAGKPVVNRTIRVDIEKLDVLMNLVSELIIAKNGLVSTSNNDSKEKNSGFNEQIEYLERVTTNLHESVMKVRMMPIETVTQKFPKMVRDLSKKLNKQMRLTMTGEDTELDRTVIDELGDPLMHLLRNSADHGLESEELRKERGKDPVGSIILNAFQDGNNVVIEVGDDGNGIDVEAVKQKALEKGAITPEQGDTMSDKEIIDLLFQPSFSTAKVVSDVSGRGVGLDVVKTKIESLGGAIEVKTALGEGSTFSIRLPLTLAIIQALMVEIGYEKYAISLDSIQAIEDVLKTDIKYVQSKEVINLRGNVIPIIRLHEILDIEKIEDEENDNLTVVIIKKGDKQAGLVVDRLIGQQEIVIKSLGSYIDSGNKLISGATILGNGDVALILDANTLI